MDEQLVRKAEMSVVGQENCQVGKRFRPVDGELGLDARRISASDGSKWFVEQIKMINGDLGVSCKRIRLVERNIVSGVAGGVAGISEAFARERIKQLAAGLIELDELK